MKNFRFASVWGVNVCLRFGHSFALVLTETSLHHFNYWEAAFWMTSSHSRLSEKGLDLSVSEKWKVSPSYKKGWGLSASLAIRKMQIKLQWYTFCVHQICKNSSLTKSAGKDMNPEPSKPRYKWVQPICQTIWHYFMIADVPTPWPSISILKNLP